MRGLSPTLLLSTPPAAEVINAMTMANCGFIFCSFDNLAVQMIPLAGDPANRTKGDDRDRTEWGEWKAPIDELAEELDMSEGQKAAAIKIFDKARGDFAELLDTKREDGTSVLSDFAEDLKAGTPQEEAQKDFVWAIQHENKPGSDTSILQELLLIKEDVMQDLLEELDEDQMRRLRKLKVDSLLVQTGYDPIKDYIVPKMRE